MQPKPNVKELNTSCASCYSDNDLCNHKQLLITKDQWEWYTDKSNFLPYFKGLHLTLREEPNTLDLRNEGLDLNNWQKVIDEYEYAKR